MARALLALLLISAGPATAWAVPTITVGDHILLPNTAGQVIQILVSSAGEEVPGLDLFLVVGELGSPGFPAASGPVITAVDIVGPGTIFNPNNVGQFDLGPPFTTPGQQPTALTTTASGTVPADGVLAFVTLDMTGVFGGPWSLSLTNVQLGPSDFATDPGNDAILIDGCLNCIPEPSTLVLASLALGWLCIVGMRGACASATPAHGC